MISDLPRRERLLVDGEQIALVAIQIAKALRRPEITDVDGAKLVCGRLRPPDFKARISVEVRHDLLFEPPAVRCQERWVRREPDWHYNSDGTMCWELAERWRSNQHLHRPPGLVAQEVCDWLLTSVENLLRRHWHGHLWGLDRWLPEWDCYSHGWRGSREFVREHLSLSKKC